MGSVPEFRKSHQACSATPTPADVVEGGNSPSEIRRLLLRL